VDFLAASFHQIHLVFFLFIKPTLHWILSKLWCDHFNPQWGQFKSSDIRLGSHGNIYYEYMLKIWLQQGGVAYNESSVTYLWNMYEEAMGSVMHLLVKKWKSTCLVFVGELPNGPNCVVHPKMDHLLCYTFWSTMEKIWKFATDDKNDKLHTGLLPIRNKSSLGGWGILCNKLAYFWVYVSLLVNRWKKFHTLDVNMVTMFCRCVF
jgi:hypothetical protein